jgi:UDP-hydrolysing UDP-N-acetyl-D-glucosamine 2-epimerase
MKKICAVTGSRADYTPLSPVLKELRNCPDVDLKLFATGTHLSPEFGLTYRDIEADGMVIDEKLEILLSSDSAVGIAKSMGIAMGSFADAYSRHQPDLILGLGDRYELLAAVSAALVCCIPVAHIGGGDITVGAIDDDIRHAVTKMSHLHFPATEVERDRIIRMGEAPDQVFAVGETGLDTIRTMEFLSRDELSEALGVTFQKRNLLLTYHPVTTEVRSSEEQFREILAALDRQKDTMVFFTQANADADGRIINEMMADYAFHNRERAALFRTLGDRQYLSIMKEVDAVVGNSSSGIIETPSLKVPTIDVGDRQKGRRMVNSVIHCDCKCEDICNALDLAASPEFQEKLKNVVNPYGDGHSAGRIVPILTSCNLSNILKKRFYTPENL